MSTSTCVVCDANTDTRLCGRCTARLEEAIGELPALLAELDVTVTRQDRGTGKPLNACNPRKVQQPGVHYPEGDSALPNTAWPFSWDAADQAWSARNTLSRWTRSIAKARNRALDLPDVHAGPAHAWCMHTSCDTIRDGRRRDARICAWLLRHATEVRQLGDAGELYDELTWLVFAIREAIDRQEPDAYYGRCDAPDVRVDMVGDTLTPRASICGAELMGRTGESEVKCRSCGASYDTRARKAALRRLLPDRVATVRVIADGLTKLDEPVTVDQITKWVERGQIPQRGADGKGHKLVRVGDVQAHLAALKERLAKPRTRRKITAA